MSRVEVIVSETTNCPGQAYRSANNWIAELMCAENEKLAK